MFKIAVFSLTLLLNAVACFDGLMTLDKVNEEFQTEHLGQTDWEDLKGTGHDHDHDHDAHHRDHPHKHASSLLVASVEELERTGHDFVPCDLQNGCTHLKMVKKKP